MRRFAVVLALVSSFAVFGRAEAACVYAGVGEGIYVKDGPVEIFAFSFGTTLAGPAEVCDDGTVGETPSTGFVSITVNGVEVCSSDDVISADPFGFSLSIHATGEDCSADVSVGLVKYSSANADTVTGLDPPHEDMLGWGVPIPSPAIGSYSVNGNPTKTLPAGHPGWFVRGALVDLG